MAGGGTYGAMVMSDVSVRMGTNVGVRAKWVRRSRRAAGALRPGGLEEGVAIGMVGLGEVDREGGVVGGRKTGAVYEGCGWPRLVER